MQRAHVDFCFCLSNFERNRGNYIRQPNCLLLAVVAVGVGAATVAGVDVAGGTHVELHKKEVIHRRQNLHKTI